VGWGGTLDTTLFTDGPHALEITATGADGKQATQALLHGVKSGSTTPIKIYLDAPGASGSTFAGSGLFSGLGDRYAGIHYQRCDGDRWSFGRQGELWS